MALTSSSIRSVPQFQSAEDIPHIFRWLRDLRTYLNTVGSSQEVEAVIFAELTAPPTPAKEGTMARADGTNWDPDGFGLGGLFYYSSGSWTLIRR